VARITLVLARADNGVIGNGAEIPWRIPGEQKRFKALTMDTPMVMGRKTFDSLPGLLPGRRHIVLTRDAAWAAEGAEVAASVEAAIALAGEADVLSVIGGAEIYALFLPVADRIELTEVHLAPAGDVIVPPFGREWRETAREDHETHSYVTLDRA
jgi:dihydrofolate reductase